MVSESPLPMVGLRSPPLHRSGSRRGRRRDQRRRSWRGRRLIRLAPACTTSKPLDERHDGRVQFDAKMLQIRLRQNATVTAAKAFQQERPSSIGTAVVGRLTPVARTGNSGLFKKTLSRLRSNPPSQVRRPLPRCPARRYISRTSGAAALTTLPCKRCKRERVGWSQSRGAPG
jgi:hypothetical protein